MEVDGGEVDSQLLQLFGSMATTDRDVLIAEFQALLGGSSQPGGFRAAELSDDNCAFFLDMNNWNLQAAICSYLECTQTLQPVPQMSFVADLTIGEGESVPPSTQFTKTWRIRNSGSEPWPVGCYMRLVAGGEQFGGVDVVAVGALVPGATTDVGVTMTSPAQTGIHQAQWRLSTANGQLFGEHIWMIVSVEEGGVLALTQQLAHFGADLHPPHAHPALHASHENPFGSPRQPDDGDFANDVPMPASLGPVLRGGHSSLPTSPCHRDVGGGMFGGGGEGGEGGDAEGVTSAIARSRLFQTPDNSPSRTIGGATRSTAPQAFTFFNVDM